MPESPSTSDQIRASAIWPTAAAAWLSSSLSGPRGSLSRLRPSAIEPEDTIRSSRPSLCSFAMSAASAVSQASRTWPASESISSDEPTLTTIRRNFFKLGRAMDAVWAMFAGEGSGFVTQDERRKSALRGRRRPWLGLRGALGLAGYRRFTDHLDQRAQRLPDAVAGRARHQQGRFPGGAFQPVALLLQLIRFDRVDLVQRHDLDLVGELAFTALELGPHGLVGLAGMLAGRVDQMQQHPAALDMAEKPIAEAGPFMGALDQPRNIRQHEFAAVDINHPELRMQRRERIVGDLRLRRAHLGKEGRLAGIRQSDQAGIGDQFEPQPDPALFAFLARIGVARRAIGGRLEVGVAEGGIA